MILRTLGNGTLGYFEEYTLGHFEEGTLGHKDRGDCTLGHKGFLARALTEDDTLGHLKNVLWDT